MLRRRGPAARLTERRGRHPSLSVEHLRRAGAGVAAERRARRCAGRGRRGRATRPAARGVLAEPRGRRAPARTPTEPRGRRRGGAGRVSEPSRTRAARAAGDGPEQRARGLADSPRRRRSPRRRPPARRCRTLRRSSAWASTTATHAEEAGLPEPSAPMFLRQVGELAGRAPRTRSSRRPSREVDYEAELAVVVGRRGRTSDAARALGHVAGAMAFDDVSARDLQMANPLRTSGKAIDTSGPAARHSSSWTSSRTCRRSERRGRAGRHDGVDNLPCGGDGRLAVADDDDRAGRHHRHGDPRRPRQRPRGPALPAPRRHGRDRGDRHRRNRVAV